MNDDDRLLSDHKLSDALSEAISNLADATVFLGDALISEGTVYEAYVVGQVESNINGALNMARLAMGHSIRLEPRSE